MTLLINQNGKHQLKLQLSNSKNIPLSILIYPHKQNIHGSNIVSDKPFIPKQGSKLQIALSPLYPHLHVWQSKTYVSPGIHDVILRSVKLQTINNN